MDPLGPVGAAAADPEDEVRADEAGEKHRLGGQKGEHAELGQVDVGHVAGGFVDGSGNRTHRQKGGRHQVKQGTAVGKAKSARSAGLRWPGTEREVVLRCGSATPPLARDDAPASTGRRRPPARWQKPPATRTTRNSRGGWRAAPGFCTGTSCAGRSAGSGGVAARGLRRLSRGRSRPEFSPASFWCPRSQRRDPPRPARGGGSPARIPMGLRPGRRALRHRPPRPSRNSTASRCPHEAARCSAVVPCSQCSSIRAPASSSARATGTPLGRAPCAANHSGVLPPSPLGSRRLRMSGSTPAASRGSDPVHVAVAGPRGGFHHSCRAARLWAISIRP